MEDLGRPSGVRAPESDVRDMGRGGGTISVRDDGLACDEILARELGRLMSESGPRFGRGPKDSRLTADVLSRGTWLDLDPATAARCWFVGVVSSPATDDAADRFRDRIVTDDGTPAEPLTEARGDARGGVCVGAGSLDRTECTRASRRCICAVSVRICERELEAGILCVPGRAAVERFAGVRNAAGLAPIEGRLAGARDVVEGAGLVRGFGVASAEGSRDLRAALDAAAGVLDAAAVLGRGAEASDMGGDGGSWTSDAAPAADEDFISGGVETRGELAVEFGEPSTLLSKVGDSGTEMSVEMVERWRASCFLILAWSSSASIFRSESSSRRRCDSIRSFSRSCSPTLISSSIITPRSMAWLYLDSMSSSDDVVLRACRSKSSLATSMSLNFRCIVRFESRSVVISFSRDACAVLPSFLDSLYFLCATSV